MMPSLVD